ncbi:MAG: NifB/NifX family molybdenum-iron cluster-binding protein [Planctomycetota bacterium]|jgi:predicted Fe-Mo cluster-binding NifX family protein
MKVAVTSTGTTLEHYVAARASCCGYLLIVDTATMQYEAVQNPVVALRGPAAGKLFEQFLLQKGVQAVLAGSFGPHTLKLLARSGISVLVGTAGSVRRALEHFKQQPSHRPALPPETEVKYYGEKQTTI